ncbi:MAG: phosphoglucosamine mutase [Gammaproteobacteria bacterium]|nr:phosphoglucosamine mutase [Gammaproteobacteria bacterium]
MGRRYFGTDGIRGRVGEAPIAAEFVLKLGWAVGRVLAGEKAPGGRKVLIGKDTRISGYMFESALQAGLSAAGVDILLLGPMPTPAIAYLTRTLRAQAGIVISASHNPYYDNGIKFFSADGCKLPDALEEAIEAELDEPMVTVDSAALGKAERVVDAAGRYIEFCKSTIPSTLTLRGLKIVVDCANGATYHVAPDVFTELGADVIKIGVQPNGLNINKDCGATATQALQKTVLEHHADLGVALDGDGDRVIMVDNKGEVVDGDELLFIVARSRFQQGHLGGGVVGTLMTNFGLELAFKGLGIDFERVAVGDRYIMERLKEKGWLLGGESSGHIICLDRTTTGDGIVSALQVLATLIQSGCTLHELRQGMSKFPQRMINVPLNNGFDFRKSDAVTEALKAAESALGSEGRVLLRESGTEPLIRVMVEGSDAQLVKRLAAGIAEVISGQQTVA